MKAQLWPESMKNLFKKRAVDEFSKQMEVLDAEWGKALKRIDEIQLPNLPHLEFKVPEWKDPFENEVAELRQTVKELTERVNKLEQGKNMVGGLGGIPLPGAPAKLYASFVNEVLKDKGL